MGRVKHNFQSLLCPFFIYTRSTIKTKNLQIMPKLTYFFPSKLAFFAFDEIKSTWNLQEGLNHEIKSIRNRMMAQMTSTPYLHQIVRIDNDEQKTMELVGSLLDVSQLEFFLKTSLEQLMEARETQWERSKNLLSLGMKELSKFFSGTTVSQRSRTSCQASSI